MERIEISINPSDMAILEVHARQRRCSVEEIVLEAIEAFVKKSHRV